MPFTSADVKFTFEEALLRYHSRTRAALEPLLVSIETPDDLTVVFTLGAPYPALLHRLDVVEAPIIPRHVYEGQDLLGGPASRRPIGTGPFRFVSYIPDNRVVLERNQQYFRDGRPGVDRLVFKVMPNASTALAALEKGEVDFVNAVPGPDAVRLRNTPGIEVEPSPGGPGGSACQEVLIPNLSRPALADVRVRRAIAHAIDLRFIVDRVYFGQGRPATGPISHLLAWAYTPNVRQYEHDPGRAGRLLDAAGWKPRGGGERLSLTFTHAAGHERLGLALREQLAAVGIDLRLQTLDFNAAVDKVFAKKDFDLGIASYCNGADPDVGVRRVYVSTNIGPFPFSNGAGYRNPRIDQLFDEASRELDRGRRRFLYAEVQRLLADDVPYFWLVDSLLLRAYRSTFTGFRLWTGSFCESVRPVRAAVN
jgi:peptide/nickel transport system substrate-binding protein